MAREVMDLDTLVLQEVLISSRIHLQWVIRVETLHYTLQNWVTDSLPSLVSSHSTLTHQNLSCITWQHSITYRNGCQITWGEQMGMPYSLRLFYSGMPPALGNITRGCQKTGRSNSPWHRLCRDWCYNTCSRSRFWAATQNAWNGLACAELGT